jgi:hypothetical protein
MLGHGGVVVADDRRRWLPAEAAALAAGPFLLPPVRGAA